MESISFKAEATLRLKELDVLISSMSYSCDIVFAWSGHIQWVCVWSISGSQQRCDRSRGEGLRSVFNDVQWWRAVQINSCFSLESSFDHIFYSKQSSVLRTLQNFWGRTMKALTLSSWADLTNPPNLLQVSKCTATVLTVLTAVSASEPCNHSSLTAWSMKRFLFHFPSSASWPAVRVPDTMKATFRSVTCSTRANTELSLSCVGGKPSQPCSHLWSPHSEASWREERIHGGRRCCWRKSSLLRLNDGKKVKKSETMSEQRQMIYICIRLYHFIRSPKPLYSHSTIHTQIHTLVVVLLPNTGPNHREQCKVQHLDFFAHGQKSRELNLGSEVTSSESSSQPSLDYFSLWTFR